MKQSILLSLLIILMASVNVFSHTYGSNNYHGYSIVKTHDNGYFLCGGLTESADGGRATLVKLDQNFNFVWEIFFGDTVSWTQNMDIVRIPNSSNYLIVQACLDYANPNFLVFSRLIKIDEQGNVLSSVEVSHDCAAWNIEMASINIINSNNFFISCTGLGPMGNPCSSEYHVDSSSAVINDSTPIAGSNHWYLNSNFVNYIEGLSYTGNQLWIDSVSIFGAQQFRQTYLEDHTNAYIGDSTISGNSAMWYVLYDSLGNTLPNTTTSITYLPQLNRIRTYPNPSTGSFNYNSGSLGDNITIFNLLNNKAESRIINNIPFQVTDLRPGVYIIKNLSNSKGDSDKIIVIPN